MKRNSKRLSGWIVLAVIALSVGMIGAREQFPPEGPLGFLYAQIHALFVETGLLAAESDDQQEQIDQLTGAVCELSVLTGNPTHPEFCEVVVTETCGCERTVEVCACDPGPYFELESCEPGDFPHPALGEIPPPKCGMVKGCQGTFTRIAPGDAGDIEVELTCKSDSPGPSGTPPCPPPPACPCGCSNGICDISCW